MSVGAISTASLSGILRLPIQQTQSRLAQAQTELATGRHADVGLLLGGRTADATSLHGLRARLDSFSDANALASTRLQATAGALSVIQNAVQSLQNVVVSGTAGTATPASMSQLAKSTLATVTSALNTSVTGQFAFAGVNTDVQPLAADGAGGKQAIINAFATAFGFTPDDARAGSISASAMQTFVDGPFAQQFTTANWQNWSTASTTAISAKIAPARMVVTSVTANDPAIRQAVKAVTLLSELNIPGLSREARDVVLASASNALSTSVSALADLQGSVGAMQNTVAVATDGLSRTKQFVDSQISGLEDSDPAELSTRIASLTTQLESAYALTSRISQLSLVRYLP